MNSMNLIIDHSILVFKVAFRIVSRIIIACLVETCLDYVKMPPTRFTIVYANCDICISVH